MISAAVVGGTAVTVAGSVAAAGIEGELGLAICATAHDWPGAGVAVCITSCCIVGTAAHAHEIHRVAATYMAVTRCRCNHAERGACRRGGVSSHWARPLISMTGCDI